MATIYHEEDPDSGVLSDQKIAVLGCTKQRLAIAATPCHEVHCSGLMEALQAPRHAFKVQSRDLLVCDPNSEKPSGFPKGEKLSRGPGSLLKLL